LAYISAAESIRVSSPTITQSAKKATEFGEIMQPITTAYDAVQGHSRSPSLVPIESSYATSY